MKEKEKKLNRARRFGLVSDEEILKKRAIRFGLACDEEVLKKRAERFKEQLGNNENINFEESRKSFSKKKFSGNKTTLKQKNRLLKKRRFLGKGNFGSRKLGFIRRRTMRGIRRNQIN